jgi:5-methylcytosine-specific restriction endonuclease McrA
MEFKLNFRNNKGTDQELLDDVRRVALELGLESLTTIEYDENGKYASTTVSKRFGNWNKAIEKAGLQITYIPSISQSELFENLESIWINLGRQPTRREMKKPLSKYSEGAYVRRFGSWTKSLEAFVEFITAFSDENEKIQIEETEIENTVKPEIVYKHKTKRSPSERLKVQVLMRDGNKCRLCGITVTGDNIHFDHILAWSKGGETTLENLQVLCEAHNLAKGNIGYDDI